MNTYILISKHSPFPQDALARLEPHIDSTYEVAKNAVLVKCEVLTSKGVSTAAFPEDHRHLSHMVVKVEHFWGWHATDLWEWLNV